MIIITEGCEVLTEAAPKTVTAIEELMNLFSAVAHINKRSDLE